MSSVWSCGLFDRPLLAGCSTGQKLLLQPSFGWDVKPRSGLSAIIKNPMALLVKNRGVTPVSWPNYHHWPLSWPPNNPHPLDWLYDSLSSPPVSGVWWAHTLDWLYDSLSSPPVSGVWWAHTLDWLYDSLSSPPVSGVWWAHTLDWLYDSLSSPPVSGVWWAHTLDWLYDSLSSPPVSGVWWAHTLDWLYDSLSSPPVSGLWWAHTLDWLYDSLSSPPVSGVWWAHWHRCPVAAVASSKWMLHTGGGWGETPPTHDWLKRFGCTTTKHYINASFIHSQLRTIFFAYGPRTDLLPAPLRQTTIKLWYKLTSWNMLNVKVRNWSMGRT